MSLRVRIFCKKTNGKTTVKEITARYSTNNLLKIEGKDYNLIGLPLFNEKQNGDFKEQYNKLHSNKQ